MKEKGVGWFFLDDDNDDNNDDDGFLCVEVILLNYIYSSLNS